MSKALTTPALNKVNIIGKLLETTFASGKLSDGRDYERATMLIRVTQNVAGHVETSEIPVSLFAAKYKKDGNSINPGYDNLQQLKKAKTAQNDGIGAADTVTVRGANLRENNFVSRTSGSLISGWQINTSFVSNGSGGKDDIASFDLEIFVMDMHDEVDREGDPTGRMIIKGGLVQYNGTLDVLDFVVEEAEGVDYFSRTYSVNDTIHVKGRVRVTSQEVQAPVTSGGWGEEIPDTTTRTMRELVITNATGDAYDEDFAYNETDIRKAFQVRKANIEQMLLDAKKAAAPKKEETSNKYDWQ